MKLLSVEVWKDTAEMVTFTKKQISRGECWEVKDYQEEKISVCRQAQEKAYR